MGAQPEPAVAKLQIAAPAAMIAHRECLSASQPNSGERTM